jgi:hypothetical protein
VRQAPRKTGNAESLAKLFGPLAKAIFHPWSTILDHSLESCNSDNDAPHSQGATPLRPSEKPGPPGLEVLKGRNSLPHSAENAAHWKNRETSHRAPYKTHSLSPSGFCMLWFSQGLKRIWGDAAARRNEGCHCRNVDSYWRLAFSCGFAAVNGPTAFELLDETFTQHFDHHGVRKDSKSTASASSHRFIEIWMPLMFREEHNARRPQR